jgi:hypothetical protein
MKLKTIVEQIMNEAELYHVTDKDKMESFVKNGIIPDMAGSKHAGAGASQGKGFYVFTNKHRAYKHAPEFGGDVIVVIDHEIAPEDFDIDYEDGFNLCKAFLRKYIDFVKSHQKELEIRLLMGDTAWSYSGVLGNVGFGRVDQPSETSPRMADAMSKVFQNLERINRSLFEEFENEYLKRADAIKYNGKEKIFPTRIEDLEGNILWKRK